MSTAAFDIEQHAASNAALMAALSTDGDRRLTSDRATQGLKAQDGSTINKGWLIIDAYWYASTSDHQARRSYKLLEEELVLRPHSGQERRAEEADLRRPPDMEIHPIDVAIGRMHQAGSYSEVLLHASEEAENGHR